jgi:hypothetical protein
MKPRTSTSDLGDTALSENELTDSARQFMEIA